MSTGDKHPVRQKIRTTLDTIATVSARAIRAQPPLLATFLPDHDQVNARLREKFMAMRSEIPDVVANSTRGPFFYNKWLSKQDLWQSDDPDIQTLRRYVESYVNARLKLLKAGQRMAIFSMWCIVGGTGLTGRPHSHGGQVSGVYYVDPGSAGPDNGSLQFLPRWGKSLWGKAIRPSRRCWDARIAEYVSGLPIVTPKSGLIVLFPSRLMHSVKRYMGQRERIIVSFNLK